MNQGFVHRPVMRDEVVELFSAVPPGLVADATVGGGGHAEALLRAVPGVRIVGIDRDQAAVTAATDRLAPFGGRAIVRHARFDQLTAVVGEVLGEDPTGLLSGVMFDLGVSSPQLDDADRGFSYRLAAPLDMRMDREEARTAADVLETLDERALAALLTEHGESRFARRIARAIVAGRPFSSTTALADAVRDAVPAAARRRGHPAKRVFQALRVVVNDELDLLGPAVDAAIELLAPGGRCVVLSYHSGEDRIVKQRFAEAATGGCTCPPGLPCVCGATPTVHLLTRGARMPSAAETGSNPRAASARLRAVERVTRPAGDDESGAPR